MSATLQAALELERALEQLVRLLDAASSSAAEIRSASHACSRRFDELRALDGSADPAARAALGRALRFNAIASELTDRRWSDTGLRLERVRSTRRRLQQQAEAAPTGEACDIEG